MYPVTLEADYRSSPPTIARGGGAGGDFFAELLRQHSDAREAAPQPRADSERNATTRPELTEKVDTRNDRDEPAADDAAEVDRDAAPSETASDPKTDGDDADGTAAAAPQATDGTVAAAPESTDDTVDAAAMPVVPVPAGKTPPAAPADPAVVAANVGAEAPAMPALSPAAATPAAAGAAQPDLPADATAPLPAATTKAPAAATAPQVAATAPAIPVIAPGADAAPASTPRDVAAHAVEPAAHDPEADIALHLSRSAPGSTAIPVSAPQVALTAGQNLNHGQPQGLSQGLGMLGSGADAALAAQAAGEGPRNPALGADAKGTGSGTRQTPANAAIAGGPANGGTAAAGTAAPNGTGQPAAAAVPQTGASQPAASFDAALDQAAPSDIDGVSGGSTGAHGAGTPAAGGSHGTAATHVAKTALVPGTPAEQLAVQVQRAVRDGNSRITVQLNPVELGHVEVQLDFAQDGRVSATILADRPETLDMLQRDARSLERSLQNAGLQTDSGSLSFDLRGGNQQGAGSHNLAGGNNGFGGNGNGPAHSDNRRATPVEQAAPVLTRSSDSGVDIHV